MLMIGKILNLLAWTLGYACVATVIAETILLGMMWKDGAFESNKRQRYAAVIYEFDLAALRFPGQPSPSESTDPATQRDQLLDTRVRNNATLALRHEALKRGTDEIRGRVQSLSTQRERYEIVKSGFNELLLRLEKDVDAAAITEVRRTLEVLQPKQSKDLIIDMLVDGTTSPEDDVMQDVLTMIRAMPQDKLKKIFGEFKTEQERAMLSKVLLAMGELES